MAARCETVGNEYEISLAQQFLCPTVGGAAGAGTKTATVVHNHDSGNGPGPSGFINAAGICSEAPLVVVVVIDRPEVVLTQPLRNIKERISVVSFVSRIPPRVT